MRLEADDGRPETAPPLRRGVQTADRAVVRERQAIPEDPPSWPDILRTIELGYSDANLARGVRPPAVYRQGGQAVPAPQQPEQVLILK